MPFHAAKPFLPMALVESQTMGTNYVLQQPYDMAETYVETSPATPMFFVLFPGVDPTPWVEGLARTLDITSENGEGLCQLLHTLSSVPCIFLLRKHNTLKSCRESVCNRVFVYMILSWSYPQFSTSC